MKRFLVRLRAPTIWDPSAIPPDEGELSRQFKRVVLPVYDVFMLLAALMGIVGGLPSLVVVYNPDVSTGGAVALLLIVLTCMVGVAFPRMWRVEAIGKSLLIGFLVLYAVLLLGLTIFEDTSRGFVAGLAFATVVIPVWRIHQLRRERVRREIARANARKVLAALAVEGGIK